MRDARLVQDRAAASARPALAPEMNETRVDIDWFKAEAQTIDCNSADIERWHWQKILAARES